MLNLCLKLDKFFWVKSLNLARDLGPLAVCFTLLLCVKPASVYAASEIPGDPVQSSVQTIYLVQFAEGVAETERDATIHAMGGRLLEWLAPLRVAKIAVDLPLTAANGQRRQLPLADAQAITAIEPDLTVTGTYAINDPDALDPAKSYAATLLNLQSAWDYTTGNPNVIIAVLDTGITHAHPEFTGRILPGYDIVNDDDDPEDDYGHGTHVAGIAAAAINNGIGVAGVCGACSILPVKVLNEHNAGTWSGVAQGILYAVDHHANVITLSLGSRTPSKTIEDAVNYALAHNVLVVAAAGNANTDERFYPAAFVGVIGVGAVDKSDGRWILSNYGPNVAVMAPGNNIYSTYNDLNNQYGGYTFMTGTSMATPYVAGLAGLLFSLAPTQTITNVVQLIETTAVDLGEPGRDAQFGYGRIDPVAALRALARQEQPTAGLSGLIWQDDNFDNVRSTSESHPLSGVKVDIYDDQAQLIATTISNEAGQWQVENLLPEQYMVRVEAPTGMVATSNDEISVTLPPAAHMDNLNFGFAYLAAAPYRLHFPLILH